MPVWLQVFMERKIIGRVFGHEAEQFDASRGIIALQESVDSYGADHPFTALVPSLEGGQDPDDAFSKVPYEKGFYFLYYLQTLVGGPEKFEPFMKAYIEKFALATVTTDEFREFLLEYFLDVQALQDLDWDTWLYKPGASHLVHPSPAAGVLMQCEQVAWECTQLPSVATPSLR
jgi:leukotriene-A4 hydrolase